mgnify:CR=1 FL=1
MNIISNYNLIIINYCEKAAALGNKEAMRDIAFMYEYGLGVEKNLETAKFWSEKGKI